jgi:hypothetical protein
MLVNFVTDLGEKVQVPIISSFASSPLTSIRSSYFFRGTQNDSTQVNVILVCYFKHLDGEKQYPSTLTTDMERESYLI